MERARAIEGLGWVDATSRRFVLPRASSSSVIAPESALLFELVERDEGPMAIVRGSALDDEYRAAVRACLGNVVNDVAFIVASEKDAYLVDQNSDVLACAEALQALRRQAGLDEALIVASVSRAAYVDAMHPQALELDRDRAPIEAHYASAPTAAVIRADVDRLMVYNDWLGVIEGDLLLARVLGMACDVARGPRVSRLVHVSLLRREVVLTSAGMDAAAAQALAQELVDGMRRMRVQLRHPEVRHVPYMTLSAGAVWIADTSCTPLDRALDEADAAVESAKLEGRDRVSLTRVEP